MEEASIVLGELADVEEAVCSHHVPHRLGRRIGVPQGATYLGEALRLDERGRGQREALAKGVL